MNGYLDDKRKEKAFAPKPNVPPLTDILLDAWSLTTITTQMPGRLEVAPYLHGLTNDPPETYVVWRKEVALLSDTSLDVEALGRWFEACPVEAQERLRDRTDRVKKALDTLLRNHRKKDQNCDFPVVLLNERGEARWSRLSAIVEKEFSLAYRTVALPVEAGGLSTDGVLDANILSSAADVAEAAAAGNGRRRERWLVIQGADGERYERLMNGKLAESLPFDLSEWERITLQQTLEGAEDQGHERYLVLGAQPRRSSLDHAETAKLHQPLDFHLNLIADRMDRTTRALGLDMELRGALRMAAVRHDWGKNRPVWQWYACNPDPRVPLAKSMKYLDGRALGGYRHEFGSLLEARAEEELRKRPEADLILHLIAAHHGWARPHFERNAWDNSRTTAENEEAAAEAMRRFGRLQHRFGRWGLAWLESLIRCADIAASQPDTQPMAAGSHEGVNP